MFSGLLLPAAFAPFHWPIIALISLTSLLLILHKSTPKQALYHGLLFGLGFFGVGTSWVYISIHHFANASILASISITLALTLLLALFVVATCYLSVKLAKNARTLCLFSFPATWVLFEYLRTYIPFGGFPWLLIGYSQTNNILAPYAPILGIYFISILICISAGSMALLLIKPLKKSTYISLLVMVLIWIGGKQLAHIQWTKSMAKKLAVSLIQGNIPQSTKWNPHDSMLALTRYTQASKELKNQLIIWPETAIPQYRENIPLFFMELRSKLNSNNSTLITGEPIYNNASGQYYNGLWMLGKHHGEYLKRHLVPFGEYFPLQQWLHPILSALKIPMSSFTPGPNSQTLLHIGATTISPFICYEIIYPQLALNSVKHANILLTISDDSWFGHSIARAQHLQMAQMRSLETGRAQIFSSNNGITALINKQGEITVSLPTNQFLTLHGSIHPAKGSTPLMHWGYWPTFLLCIGLLALTILP